jgi:hypothetical protein
LTTGPTPPRFVLIDQSLTGFVGHHYAYARLMLAAAREAGFRPVLAANRRLGDLGPDFPEVEVHRPFRHTTYTRHTYDADHRPRIATRLVRALRIRSFAAGCAALFAALPLEEGDVVFGATMSELDFAGLSRWLVANPTSRRASWHVQFHLNLFRGREGDYARQEPLAAMVRGVLAAALAPLGGHRLRLHCTTEALVRQYERLGVGRFAALTYPIDEAFVPRPETPAEARPLRVAFLGHNRREKGTSHLQKLVDELWEPYLRTGRVQLVVQARPGKLHLALPADASEGVEPVVFAPVGLSRDRYVELVRDTDVGLLLYDALRYYTRCSGVLLEMLCAGVPVLVPAANWLADQIAEPIQLQLDALSSADGPECVVATGANLGAAPQRFRLALESPAHDLLVSCAWGIPLAPGDFVAMEVLQFDAAGATLATSSHILGPREGGRPERALVRVADEARTLELSLRNAYADKEIALSRLTSTSIPKGRPAGAVGLIAADLSAAPAMVREMIEGHEHFRKTAMAFSEECRARHAASAVAASLLAD